MIGLSITVAVLVVGTGILILLIRRRKSVKEDVEQEPKSATSFVSKIPSAKSMGSRHRRETMDGNLTFT